MKNILIVEDDKALAEGIVLVLRQDGFSLQCCHNVKDAKKVLEKNIFDLILLDINLPDGSGLDICRELRKEERLDPVIFLTALDTELHEVTGFQAGADDYITKPFSLMVLISKVNALMRRIESTHEEGNVLTSGNIQVWCKEMKVFQEEQEVSLSKKEIQLLLYFLEHPKQIISKEQILESVWDMDGQFVDDNTVPVTISRLKKKLATEEDYEYIKNVRGIGYLWTTEVLKK